MFMLFRTESIEAEEGTVFDVRRALCVSENHSLLVSLAAQGNAICADGKEAADLIGEKRRRAMAIYIQTTKKPLWEFMDHWSEISSAAALKTQKALVLFEDSIDKTSSGDRCFESYHIYNAKYMVEEVTLV